jgi:hypothetical protein
MTEPLRPVALLDEAGSRDELSLIRTDGRESAVEESADERPFIVLDLGGGLQADVGLAYDSKLRKSAKTAAIPLNLGCAYRNPEKVGPYGLYRNALVINRIGHSANPRVRRRVSHHDGVDS